VTGSPGSQPRIQFATTGDGESIACCSLGQGPPLVCVPSGPWTTIQVRWGVPAWRAWDERLAAHRRLILYDPRGAGLSDPPAAGPAYHLEAQVADLHAVVQHLRLERVALFAAQHAGPAAIAFASGHPERVSHLVLWCTYAKGAEYFGEPRSLAVHRVLDQDWDLFTETVAHAQLGWSEADAARRLAALLREHLTPAVTAAFDAAARTSDVTALLPLVRTPALVLHRRQVRHPALAIARRLAAGLPGAGLVVLEGEAVAPFTGEVQAGVAAIEAFLGPAPPARPRPPGPSAAPAGAALAEALSARERDVLRLLAAGLSNAEIARELVIAPGTAKTHTSSIYRKLDVGNRTRAVARARALGLLD
jgi:DNA-binding CsgD family transcriptional regulator/pimeloyl-ACP methyl ester carboxylesterase